MGRSFPNKGIGLALAVAMVATNAPMAAGSLLDGIDGWTESEFDSFRKCWCKMSSHADGIVVEDVQNGRHFTFQVDSSDCKSFASVLNCYKDRRNSDDITHVSAVLGSFCEPQGVNSFGGTGHISWKRGRPYEPSKRYSVKCGDSLGCQMMFPKKNGDVTIGAGSQVQWASNSPGAQFAQQQHKACEGSGNPGAQTVCCKSRGAVCCSAAAFNKYEVKTVAAECPQNSPYVQQWLTSAGASKTAKHTWTHYVYLAPLLPLLAVLALALRRLRTKSDSTNQEHLSINDPEE